MIEKILAQMKEKYSESGLQMQPPCPLGAIQRVRDEAIDKLSFEIPAAYMKLLSITDGSFWNGLQIYASEQTTIGGFSDRYIDGFVEENINLRQNVDPDIELILFGEGDVEALVYNTAVSEYQMVDRVTFSLIESFSSCEHLLAKALENHL